MVKLAAGFMIWVVMNFITRDEKKKPRNGIRGGKGGGMNTEQASCDLAPNTRLSIDSVVDLDPD